MKVYLKICLLFLGVCALMGFTGSKASAPKGITCIMEATQQSNIVYKTSFTRQGNPERRIEIRLFHHGIDENDITVSEYIHGQAFAYCYLVADDHSSFKNWRKYLLSSRQNLPGYQAFLSALPLRSPPFNC